MAGALLVSTPAKLEAEKISGWISRMVHGVHVAPADGSWGVFVPIAALHRARTALRRVLSAANPHRRRVVLRKVRRPALARFNSRIELPRSQIEFVVDRLHVGTSDEDVAAEIRRRAKGAAWTPARVRRAVEYALKHHRKNRGIFSHVMRGIPNPRPPACCQKLGKGTACARCGKHTHFTVDWIIPSRRADHRPACSSACALAMKRGMAQNPKYRGPKQSPRPPLTDKQRQDIKEMRDEEKWRERERREEEAIDRARERQNPGRLPRRRRFEAHHSVMSRVGHLIEEGRLEDAANIVEEHTGRRPAPGTLRAKYSGMTMGGEPDIIYHRNPSRGRRLETEAKARLLLVRIHTILQVGAHKLDRGDRKGAIEGYNRARDLWGKLPKGVMVTPANRRTAYSVSRAMVHLQNRLVMSGPNPRHRGRRNPLTDDEARTLFREAVEQYREGKFYYPRRPHFAVGDFREAAGTAGAAALMTPSPRMKKLGFKIYGRASDAAHRALGDIIVRGLGAGANPRLWQRGWTMAGAAAASRGLGRITSMHLVVVFDSGKEWHPVIPWVGDLPLRAAKKAEGWSRRHGLKYGRAVSVYPAVSLTKGQLPYLHRTDLARRVRRGKASVSANAPVSSVWDGLTGRRRAAALMVIGYPYDYAHAISWKGWTELPDRARVWLERQWRANPGRRRLAR